MLVLIVFRVWGGEGVGVRWTLGLLDRSLPIHNGRYSVLEVFQWVGNCQI
jgi:hypothetical protein